MLGRADDVPAAAAAAHVYRLVPGALEDRPGAFPVSEILADSLARGGHAELAEETGRAHGRTLCSRHPAARLRRKRPPR